MRTRKEIAADLLALESIVDTHPALLAETYFRIRGLYDELMALDARDADQGGNEFFGLSARQIQAE